MQHHTYRVKSKTLADTYYDEDMDIGICSCPVGENGHGCKHQADVALHFGTRNINFLPHKIAELFRGCCIF